MDFEPDF